MPFLGLISPDPSLCHAISEQLMKQDSGWQLANFPSLEAALTSWSDTLPPLLFWDAQDAPVKTEMAEFFVERLRLQQPAPLVLVLGDPSEPVAAFGVTEAFRRPLRLGYVLTRLQFYQRLLQQAPEIACNLGPWIFAPRTRTVTHKENGEVVKLTDKEAELLECLCAAASPIPRDELLGTIWGYDSRIDTHTLETHIYRLRRKLMGAQAEGPDLFVVEQGLYQINPAWRK